MFGRKKKSNFTFWIQLEEALLYWIYKFGYKRKKLKNALWLLPQNDQVIAWGISLVCRKISLRHSDTKSAFDCLPFEKLWKCSKENGISIKNIQKRKVRNRSSNLCSSEGNKLTYNRHQNCSSTLGNSCQKPLT